MGNYASHNSLFVGINVRAIQTYEIQTSFRQVCMLKGVGGRNPPTAQAFHRWVAPTLRPSLGLEWVLRPGMLGISAPQVLADLVVGRGPEAVEVIGDLDGPEVGSEQVEEDRDAAAGQARGLGPAEELLDPCGEDRRPPGFIGQSGPTAGRQRERLRRTLAELPRLSGIEPGLQERDEVDLADFVAGCRAATDLLSARPLADTVRAS